MGHLTPSRKGVITAIYYLGTWLSYVFISHATSDRFGRRYAALAGVLTVAVGNAFECGATGSGAYAMMIVGRVISGVGVGMLSTSVPLYQRYLLRTLHQKDLSRKHGTNIHVHQARFHLQGNAGNTSS